MSADRERNHDMTQTDIAFLLADAADEVEIGIAPVQAVMRGGRRRRARRWAVAAATALVLAGSTGATLALTGVPGGGHGGRQVSVAKPPASAEARHVYEPQETELSRGVYKGKPWSVQLQVWGAPRNREEAARQFDAMIEARTYVGGATRPADLIGKISYFAIKRYGTDRQQVLFNTVEKLERMSGTDLESASVPMDKADDSREVLVVGKVAKTAREVTCRWKDGTTSVARRGPVVYRHNIPDPAIVPAGGFSGADWFVCMAPEGTSARTAEVTK